MLFEQYFERFGYPSLKLPSIKMNASAGVIVIPAYKETSIMTSFKSLINADLMRLKVGVIVVFNASEKDVQAQLVNQKAEQELEEYLSAHQELRSNVHIMNVLLPHKHAGVGLARKLGMDLASRVLEASNNELSPIICFDADSSCEENLLFEILQFFNTNPKVASCSIHYEHPLIGTDYESTVYEGIEQYELHLRYYVLGLKYAQLPFAFHTIGSSMAVRAIDYMKQGGMNKRKAGEDFYFLQKFIALGVHSNLNSTTVIPSPRSSDRVPFGTGRAILEMEEKDRDLSYSYSWQSFETLKTAFSKVDSWYEENANFHPLLVAFLGLKTLTQFIEEAKLKSKRKEQFRMEFFKKFNAFQCLKFMHFLRDFHFPNEPMETTVPLLINQFKNPLDFLGYSLLKALRKIEKGAISFDE